MTFAPFRFQEQYLFCYKVWLEVLQGILQLQGNQWQPESPRDHKIVWMFPPSNSATCICKAKAVCDRSQKTNLQGFFFLWRLFPLVTCKLLLSGVRFVTMKLCLFLIPLFFRCFFSCKCPHGALMIWAYQLPSILCKLDFIFLWTQTAWNFNFWYSSDLLSTSDVI